MTFQEIGRRADLVRGIPLEAVLSAIGAKPDRYDKAKWRTQEGVISVTGMKFMNWNHGSGGGGAIDLVIHLKHFGFKSAVHWLWEHFPQHCHSEKYQPPPEPKLQLPERDDSKMSRVIRYLVEQRALPTLQIETLIQSGTLYADARGNAVFLLIGNEGRPVGAELRGTTHRPWRSMALGSRKNLGYFSVRPSRDTAIILCESAIDALSCHVLHPDCLCISTSGARPRPPWLYPLIIHGYRVYCGFDSDSTGENMAQALISLHPSVRRIRPVKHDWNDVLRARCR